MKKYIALLRGINVGGNKKVEMFRLKKVFEDMGYTDVSTYINSGNVIFSSRTDDFSEVEGKLRETFGFEIQALLKDAENIVKLIQDIPPTWKNDDEQKTDIIFLWDEYAHKESLSLIQVNPEVDRLLYIDGAIIWNISRSEYSKSGMRKFIGTPIYKNMTARNVNTVRKLSDLVKV